MCQTPSQVNLDDTNTPALTVKTHTKHKTNFHAPELITEHLNKKRRDPATLSNTTANPKLEPRRWQQEALAAWKAGLHGVVKVVTGGGKTSFALFCIDYLRNITPNFQVIIVVPTVALLDQWVLSLTEDAAIPPSDISTFSMGSAPSPAPFNVMVINTARTKMSELASTKNTLLIVDECHRAGSPHNVRALIGKFHATLGLSATPEREYDDGFEALVEPILGPVIYTYTLESALRDRVVVPFELHNVKINLLEEEKQSYDRLTSIIKLATSHPETHQPEKLRNILLSRATVSANAALRIPVTVRIVLNNPQHKTIVFHERIHAAQSITKTLNQKGVYAAPYHTGLPAHIRQQNLRLFRRGVIQCLVTCRALDEGLNVADADLAIIASSTNSLRQRIQRLGRVLRTTPGKSRATVYTLYATDMEESRLLAESHKMPDVAKTTWQAAKVT